jgi:TP901 family phage tail tape measure protein
MSSQLGEALIPIRLTLDQIDKDSKGVKSKLEQVLGPIGKGALLGAAGAITAVGVAAVGAGVALVDFAVDFDQASDALIVGTGATGEALTALEQVVKNIKGDVAGLGQDFGTLGAVVAEVNTRTGATGDTLEDFSSDVLNLSRLTGGDAVKNTQLITRVMGDWGVELEDSSMLMDQLFGAGQAFGIGMEDLTQKVVQFGAPLRQMGFTLEESIALFGKWEKEGVNAELAIGSLRIAAGKFAREGVDLKVGLEQTMEAIKGATTDSEGLAIAMDVFGARAGPDMAAAIREGRFELDEAIKSIQGSSGSLDDATQRSLDFQDQIEIMGNKVKIALLPVGQTFLDLANDSMPAVTDFLDKAQPIFAAFAEEFGTVLPQAVTILNDAFTRIARTFGDGTEEVSALDVVLGILKGTLDLIVTAVQAVAVTFELLSLGIEQTFGWVGKLQAAWQSWQGDLDDTKVPEIITPGSPTPLEMGLRGIADAIDQMPALGMQLDGGGTAGGIADGGAVGTTNIVNIDGITAMSQSTGDPAEDLIAMVVQLLRQQLQASAAGSN